MSCKRHSVDFARQSSGTIKISSFTSTSRLKQQKHEQAAASLVERCRLVAMYFGDEYDLRFWTVAKSSFHNYTSDKPGANALSGDAAADAVVALARAPTAHLGRVLSTDVAATAAAEAATMKAAAAAAAAAECPLAPQYGVLLPPAALRQQQSAQLAAYSRQRLSRDLRSGHAQRHLLLGETSAAVSALVGLADPALPTFHSDLLRACLVAAVTDPAGCTGTLTAAASLLRAAGRLDDAVELLCLANNHVDACLHLQAAGQWERAAMLAKTALPAAMRYEILVRWIDHLVSTNPAEAVLVALAHGQWRRVLQLLHVALGSAPALAALYLEAALAANLLPASVLNGEDALVTEVLEAASSWYAKAALQPELACYFATRAAAARSLAQ